MFVHYSTHVDVGLPEVEKRIDLLRSDMKQWADIAYREGEELRSRVGPVEGIAKSISLDIGSAEVHRTGLIYPMRWMAHGVGVIFPELNADLALTKLGSDMTSLSLDGTYVPPLGPVGRLADRIVLGRVAEATVRNWVDRLAEAVTINHQVV